MKKLKNQHMFIFHKKKIVWKDPVEDNGNRKKKRKGA